MTRIVGVGFLLLLCSCVEKAPVQAGNYLGYVVYRAGNSRSPDLTVQNQFGTQRVRLSFQPEGSGWLVSVAKEADGGGAPEEEQVSLRRDLRLADGSALADLDILSTAELGDIWIPPSRIKLNAKHAGGKVVSRKKAWAGYTNVMVKRDETELRLYDVETGFLTYAAMGQISGLDPRPLGGKVVKLEDTNVTALSK